MAAPAGAALFALAKAHGPTRVGLLTVLAGATLVVGLVTTTALAARQASRLRRVLQRLLSASSANVGRDLLARQPDLVSALERVSREHAAEMLGLRGQLHQLRDEEDGIRRVLGQVAPSSLRYALSGLDVAGVSAAKGRCGGDWYMVRRLDDAHLLIALGDVAGHDPASAYVAAVLSGALRVLSPTLLLEDPVQAVAQLAQLVDEASAGPLSSSCFLGVMDLRSWSLRFVNAGHPAPWVLRDGVLARSLTPSGGPLGLARGVTYVASVAQLTVSDRLVLFSDGVVEQRDAAGRVFGLRRLLDTTRGAIGGDPAPCSQQLLASVMQGFHDFCGSSSLNDDVSLMVCHIMPGAAPLAPFSDDDGPTAVSLVQYPVTSVAQRR